jgi:hypothetical protein
MTTRIHKRRHTAPAAKPHAKPAAAGPAHATKPAKATGPAEAATLAKPADAMAPGAAPSTAPAATATTTADARALAQLQSQSRVFGAVATAADPDAKTATAVAAFKTLIAHAKLDASGTLSVADGNITAAQFQAAVEAVFGPVKLNASGGFDTTTNTLGADFKAAFNGLTADLQLKPGSADLTTSLTKVFGSNTLIANNELVFKDASHISATLNDELKTTLGPDASLDETLKASVDAQGVRSATAAASLKALIGNTQLDANGVLTITNRAFTQAQFSAAIQGVFGTATASATFDTSKTALAADFKTAYGALDASLTLKGGSASGTVGESLKNVLGSNTLITDNRVSFADNAFQSASLNNELVSKLGPSGSLDTVLKASLDREGIQTATATAALKVLLGNTTIDTSGTGLTIKNNGLSDAQFKAAVTTLFGPNATLSTDGSFQWSKAGGVDADLVSSFKVAKDNLQLAVDGTLAVKDGQASGELKDSLTALLGPNTLIADNTVVFKDNRFLSADLNASLETKLGPNASLATTFQASLDQDGIASATATAAFKALVGSTTIDTTGTQLVIKNNSLTDAQFKAALVTLFGRGAQLSSDGTFSWSKDSGVSASVAEAFKATYGAVAIDAAGNLSLRDGQLSGDVAEKLQATLGSNVVVANNQLVFEDNHFQSASLSDALTHQFGPNASLATTLDASVDAQGVRSATAAASLKALIANTKLDANGVLTITNSAFTQAQFNAAIQGVFGTATASATFDTSKTALAADFKNAYGALDASLTLKGGVASGSVSESLQNILGSNTLITNNQVSFADNAFQSASLDDELVSKLGSSGSLDTVLKASLDREGIQTATATAALKVLLGSTSIDTSGSGLTIKNNSLSDAQFKAAVTTLFGPNATLSSDGSFQWSKASGVDANLVSSFKLARENLQLGLDGTLAVKGGKLSGELKDSLTALLGPNTLVANNTVVFKDNRFQSAELNEKLTTTLGPNASLASTFEASIDQNGIASATATAAFKALVGSTTIDTTGTQLVIKNDTLSQAQFKAAIVTMFGPDAKLSSDGTFTWNKDSGVSASVAEAFKATYGAVKIDEATGSLTLSGGKLSGDLAEQLQATLGSNVVVANNQLVFKDNHFQSAALDDSLTHTFGPNASLATTLQASIDASGIASAQATAAVKALIGGATIDTTGTGFTIKNNTLTAAQFKAAIATALGPNAQLQADGTFKWTKDGGVSADLAASFKHTVQNFTVDAGGNLTLKPGGKVDGTLRAEVQAVLGAYTVVANNQIVFQDNKFVSATLNDSVKASFGDKASLDATLQATVKQNGLVDATVDLAAFKRLKDLGQGGGIDVQADGSVVIKDNHIDRAEVSALLSAMAGKDVNLSATGKLIYADGKVDPQFGANFKAAWDNTTLDAAGTVTVVDGKPEVNAHISALFGGANVKGGASLDITGADSGQLNFKLQKMGGNTQLDTTGSLAIDHGRITGAGLTTNLVTQGATPADVSLGGFISVSDGKLAGNLKAQVNAGIISGGIGVGGSSQVSIYTAGPDDPNRLAVQQKGGVWSERDATFDVSANGGVNATVLVGAVPITLGFSADGDVKREVHTLSIHASKEDALAQSPLTVVHAPTTVDQVLAMRPFEQYSDSGKQSIGMGGNAAVGFGVGPAQLKAGGSVYYQLTGNLSRDIERLDGNKVRIRFKKGEGDANVKALSANVGLDMGKVLDASALADKAAPILSQVAQAGISAKLQTMKEHDTVFDATIDVSTPYGRSALQHLLTGEMTEAEYWAGYQDSGVVLNTEMDMNLSAQTRSMDLNIGPLTKQNLSRWLDDQQRSVSANDFTFTQAVDDVHSKTPFFPWNPNTRSDVRFVHETKVVNAHALPEIGDLSTTQTMHVHIPEPEEMRPPTLDDSAAMLGLRFRLETKKTSQVTAEKNIDSALAIMKAMGFQRGEFGDIGPMRDAVEGPIAPDKSGIFLGLGDQRFGDTAVDVEGFLGPKGFNDVFNGRGAADFRSAYLQAAAVSGSVTSTAGARLAVESTLKAQLWAAKDGGFDVMRDGQRIGTLSDADLETIRQALIDGASSSDGGDFSFNAKLGQWVGARPEELVHVSGDALDQAGSAIEHAKTFADTMMKAQELWSANQPPARGKNETQDAYDARLQAWKDSSLYRKPDVFFAQMDVLFKEAISADKTPATPLAFMGLAGQEHIYGKAQLELEPDKLRAMIDKGRSNIQRFAAVTVLQRLGAKLGPDGQVSVAAKDAKAAAAAVQVLTGNAPSQQAAGSNVVLSVGGWPSDDFSDGLMKYLGGATDADTLDAVFGGTAMVWKGQVVFDNRAYRIVNFADALSALDGAIDVAHFPSLQRIQDLGAKQSYDLDGLTARHDGAESHWGEQFSHLEYLHGANEDLGKAVDPGPTDWILR